MIFAINIMKFNLKLKSTSLDFLIFAIIIDGVVSFCGTSNWSFHSRIICSFDDTSFLRIFSPSFLRPSISLFNVGYQRRYQRDARSEKLMMIYVDEIQCSLGLGEKEPPFMEEDDNGFSEDMELRKYIKTIGKSKTRFEKTPAIGMEVFPDNVLLKYLEDKYVEVIRLQTGGNTNNNFKTGNMSSIINMKDVTELHNDVTFNPPQIDKVQKSISDGLQLVGFDSPEYAFGPLTQAEVVATTLQRSRCLPTSSGKNVACTRKGKRATQVTSHMKSPFLSRVVNIDGVLSGEEHKVTTHLFQMTRDPLRDQPPPPKKGSKEEDPESQRQTQLSQKEKGGAVIRFENKKESFSSKRNRKRGVA
ncbi:hypothetical protein Tco_0661274 [Tanacetum coccineum]